MIPSITLNDGAEMPRLGLGVFLVSDVAVCEASVTTALRAGYRLIDTAAFYGNERAVGRGIRSSADGHSFVVRKTSSRATPDYGHRKATAAIDASRERLDVGPIDLLLLHQPYGDVLGAWRAMEDAVDRGTVRAIGVSNFGVPQLERLLSVARIAPVVDQLELHPYYQQGEVRRFLADHGIVPEAWYPLGHGSKRLRDEPVLAEIAGRHGKSVVQVVLRWHVQSGWVVIPKSTDPAHLVENLDVFDFELAADEMAAIDALGRARPLQWVPDWIMSPGTRMYRPRQLP